ncbi:MAG: GlsB/YeaQ/YmgE family stress response membrane protein [Pseudomonadota bacterium]
MLEAFAIILTGGLAGWIAARLVQGSGFGLVINVIVGIIGGVIGGKLFAFLDIPVGSWFVELAMAVLGAVVLLGLVNLVRRRSD